MKKMYFLWACIISFAMVSCQKEEPEPKKETGTLKLDIGVIISVKERASLYKAAPVIDEFNVHIFRADNTELMAFENVSDMPAAIELETGDYYVVAYSDNNLPAEFENPYYYGLSDPFTIGSNMQQEVVVNCQMANTIVSVVYSDNITSNFALYTCTVSSSAGSLVYAGNETRWGYFQTLPLDILAELTYLKPDGSESHQDHDRKHPFTCPEPTL